jgi:hypothetical protein
MLRNGAGSGEDGGAVLFVADCPRDMRSAVEVDRGSYRAVG